LGSDNIDVKGKIMTTVNEAVVFEHFNQKGRRLPRVYVWGCSETGALGNGGFVHPKKPKVKGEFSQRAQRAKKLKAPDPVPVVSSPYRCYQPDFYNLNISHVAAGHGFTLWVNSNNKSKLPRVVGTGLNYESQLGGVRVTDKETGEEKIIDVLLEPTDIQLPLVNSAPPLFGITHLNSKLSVVDIQAGMSHFAAIVESPKRILENRTKKEIPPFRELYTWGANRRGCLGLGREDNQPYPYKVVLAASVSQVSCGTNHTIALCDPLLL